MQRELKCNPVKGSWVIYPHIYSIEDGGFSVTAEDKYIEKRNGYEEIISNDKLFNIILSKTRACLDCGNKKNVRRVSMSIFGGER